MDSKCGLLQPNPVVGQKDGNAGLDGVAGLPVFAHQHGFQGGARIPLGLGGSQWQRSFAAAGFEARQQFRRCGEKALAGLRAAQEGKKLGIQGHEASFTGNSPRSPMLSLPKYPLERSIYLTNDVIIREKGALEYGKRIPAYMKTPLKTLCGWALAALALAAFASSARAEDTQQAVVSVNEPDFSIIGYDESATGYIWVAWKFSLSQDIKVTSLGLYDTGVNLSSPLVGTYAASLWTADGTELAFVAIASTDTLVGDFRYAAIDPLVLDAGSSYWVGIRYRVTDPGNQKDTIAYQMTPEPDGGFVTASGVTYEGGATSDVLDYPTTITASGLISANFQFEVVPEPSTYALIVSGLGALVFLRRKRP